MLFNETTKAQVFKCSKCFQYTTVVEDRCKYCQTVIDYQAAENFAKEEEQHIKAEIGLKNRDQMVRGFIVFVIGLAVTIASIYVAGPGEKFILAWGAILFGGADFLNGLFGWVQNKF